MSDEQHTPGAGDSYDGFLRVAIKSYWDRGGDRVNFVALLLASREAWGVAFSELAQPSTGRKLLTGAAGVTAIVFLLRALLGGPVGLVLTGASIASLGALYYRNHSRIWAQQERYKQLITEYRSKHGQVRGKFLEGVVDAEERDLMVDGLLRRFLDELDAADAPGEEGTADGEGEDA